MNDAISLNAPLLSNRVKINKRKVINTVEKQIMATKLEIVKEELRERCL